MLGHSRRALELSGDYFVGFSCLEIVLISQQNARRQLSVRQEPGWLLIFN